MGCRESNSGNFEFSECVPKIRHNGTQNSTKVVLKLSDAFYRMINFHHFWSPKNGSKATLTMILGTILNFWVPLIIFLEHILCKLFKKKNVPDNSHYLLTQLRITDFLSNSRFSLVGLFAFFGYHRIFYGTQNFYHRKV